MVCHSKELDVFQLYHPLDNHSHKGRGFMGILSINPVLTIFHNQFSKYFFSFGFFSTNNIQVFLKACNTIVLLFVY